MWFILDREMKHLGIIDKKLISGLPLLDDTLTERLDKGYNTLTFSIPSNHEKANLLEAEGFIVHTRKGSKFNELFRIKEIDEAHGDSMTKIVYCEPSATSDLNSQIVRPQSHTQRALQAIAKDLLLNTGWELGECFYDELITIEINDYPNALEALHRVMTQYDAEIEFLVEFSNSKVTRKLVNFYEKRGKETRINFEYERNLVGVRRRENSNNIITSLIAIGNEIDGKKLSIAETTETIPEGFQLAGDALIDLEATQLWGTEGRALEGLLTNDTATTNNELFRFTLAELKKVNKPVLTYEVDVALLGSSVEIGDTIRVKDRTFNPPLFLEARVLEKTSSETDESKGAVVLGEFVALKVSSNLAIEQLQRKIALEQDGWNRAIEEAERAKEIAEGAQDAIGNIGDAISYKVEMHSSNGYAFKRGAEATTLYAVVYKGKDNVTDTLPSSAFKWRKFNKNGVIDTAWNNAHLNVGKSINITGADVYEKATFFVDVEIV